MPNDNKNTKKKGGSKFAAFDLFGSPVAFNISGDETYKTVIGCFWTAIMVISLLGALTWYIIVYLDKTNVEVTTELLIQDEYPKIDFLDQGFFFSLYATKNKKITNIEDLKNLLQFEAFQTVLESTETSGERGTPTEKDPINIPFGPCSAGGKKGEVKGKTLQGKSSLALSDRAWCSLADEEKGHEMYVQGNEDSDTFAFVRLKIMPCNSSSTDCLFYYAQLHVDPSVTDAARCELYGNEVPLEATERPQTDFPAGCSCDAAIPGNVAQSTRCGLMEREIRDYIKDEIGKTYFTFNYVEGAVIPENYTDPFAYTMKSTIKTYGSIENTKLVNIFFREVVVNSDIGFLLEEIDTKNSVSFDLVMTDFVDRGEGKAKLEKRPDGTFESTAQSYMEFTLYSSNNQVAFSRKYTKIIDVFASVGGVAEVIGFVVVFFYAWYNGIRMEQKLLNYGVLGKSKDNEKDEQKGTGQTNEEWEKSRFFSFGELMKFGFMEKGLGCCCKKNKKFDFYQTTRDAYEKRTDVINIMKTVADVDTIKDALFSDYQIRLMPYIVNQKADDDSDLKTMTVNQAINKLNEKNVGNDEVRQAMDGYLKTYLPDQFLAGNVGSMAMSDKTQVVPVEGMNDTAGRHGDEKSPKGHLLRPSSKKEGRRNSKITDLLGD